jgi:excisionase family DNA binding protein
VTERLLTARELGELLGLAPATVLDWHEAGKLPSFKIGTAVRFRASEVEAWLEQHRCGPCVGPVRGVRSGAA